MPDENTNITIKAAKNVPKMALTVRAWVSGSGMIVFRKVNPSLNIQNMPPHSRAVSTATSATRNRDCDKVCQATVVRMRPRIRRNTAASSPGEINSRDDG